MLLHNKYIIQFNHNCTLSFRHLQSAPGLSTAVDTMSTLDMLQELSDLAQPVATLNTLEGMRQLVCYGMGSEDGLAEKLLITELAGVGHSAVDQ